MTEEKPPPEPSPASPAGKISFNPPKPPKIQTLSRKVNDGLNKVVVRRPKGPTHRK